MYCDVFCILWCILYIVMYLMYCGVFYILWCILCIVMCMNSQCIGPIVSGRTCRWLICELDHASLSHLHHSTLYCISTCQVWYIVPNILPRTPGVQQYTDDAIHILSCVWCKDGSYLYLGIRSYMAVSRMICISYNVLCFAQLYVILLVPTN